jgi:hypothetical protein
MLNPNRRVAKRLAQPLPPGIEGIPPCLVVRDDSDRIGNGPG